MIQFTFRKFWHLFCVNALQSTLRHSEKMRKLLFKLYLNFTAIDCWYLLNRGSPPPLSPTAIRRPTRRSNTFAFRRGARPDEGGGGPNRGGDGGVPNRRGWGRGGPNRGGETGGPNRREGGPEPPRTWSAGYFDGLQNIFSLRFI